MPVIYRAPGLVDDFSGGARSREGAAAWHAEVAREMSAKVTQLKERVAIDHPSFFAAHEVAERNTDAVLPVAWNAFPRGLRLARLDRARTLASADARMTAQGGFWDERMTRPRQYRHRRQDEYVEWSAVQPEGQALKYVFTVEPPEYWATIFRVDAARGLELYRQIVGRKVDLGEITFERDVWDSVDDGRPTLIHRRGDYDPHNRVNVDEHPVHLTHPDNSLLAEIDLVARATIQRADGNGVRIADRRRLACCSDFGDPNRHSDPTIGLTINTLVRDGFSVTLADPVGVYIAGLDLGRVRGPRGEDLSGWWRVTRGTPDRAVRAEFGPPPGSSLTCEELFVKGEPLTRGGQLAELINAVVFVRAARRAMPRPPMRRCNHVCSVEEGSDPAGRLEQQPGGLPLPRGRIDPFQERGAPTEPVLDGDDIQGHVLAGFGRADLHVIAVHANSAAALRAALRAVLPHVTTLASALRDKAARKASLSSGAPVPPTFHAAVSLTRASLQLLGVPGAATLDDAFAVGMDPTRTGDPTAPVERDGTPNEASPHNWVVGGPNRPLHVLVICGAANDTTAAEALVAELRAVPGVTLPYVERGTQLGDQEHFGFADGVAQVGVLGEVEVDGSRVPITTRHGVPSRYGVAYGRPGQALAWPGQFIVGAPRWEGDPGEADLDTFRNGSLLVFRRLRQDVRAFRDDTETLGRALRISGERMRELVVGRRTSGAPLVEGRGSRSLGVDYFRYFEGTAAITVEGESLPATASDVLGNVCPHWAHIRKVNPRDAATDQGDETLRTQMLRRAIPFGPRHDDAPAAARGLLFFAYQRSIGQQFEVLNSDWMNREEAPFGSGFDLLVGQRVTRGLHAPRSFLWGDVRHAVTRQWVWPAGGDYLFTPGLSALRAWSAQPTR